MMREDTSIHTPPVVPAAPLNDVMLAMDVVDTLRHRQDLAVRELKGEDRERQLIDKLRDIYHQQGIEVPDHILREGVEALAESRFVYTPPRPSPQISLARLYVTRASWGKPVLAALVVLFLALGGYFGIYRPWQSSQLETARIELAERLPAQMDAIYQSIFEETKVQQAVTNAEAIRTRGKHDAAEGNRAGAEAAIADLIQIRDTLRQEYTIKVINRQGESSGIWRMPRINTDATNYYLIVEALDADGRALTLPVPNEETGQTEDVRTWGVRVPESVYTSVAADKQDDGIIQRNTVGLKQYGFLDVDYVVPVLGGAITAWQD